MNQAEIIAMAKEAGFRIGQMDTLEGSRTLVKHASFDCLAELARFAALVAAQEREACAQVCEWMRTVPPNGEPEDVERGFNAALGRSAAAIRARGTKEGV